MPAQVIFITVGALFLAVLPLPYGYYTFLRITVTGVFAWCAFASYKNNPSSSITWIYSFLAIIFNPIIPIYLNKSIWSIIDIASAIILLTTKNATNNK